MKVVLAGYNVDREALDELRLSAPPRLDVTPETLSAAYARISRDGRPVDELRRSARGEVEKARRSNQAIIFKMGHHSVAEHAVFNFDLMGISRLAIEAVERFRLASFTEKSQRYITLGEDFVVPEEVVAAGLKPVFLGAVKAQNALYHRLYRKLRPHVLARHPEAAADPETPNPARGLGQGGRPLRGQPGHRGTDGHDGQCPRPGADDPPLCRPPAGRGARAQPAPARAGQGRGAVDHPLHPGHGLRRRNVRRLGAPSGRCEPRPGPRGAVRGRRSG